jgi:Pvc16 N-terminal domain
MSNHLAIATVTATLARIIQTGIQSATGSAPKVTMLQPSAGSAIPETGVNVYLYQVSPNTSYINSDLTHRRPKGDLIRRAQIGVDLSYMLTVYGDEQRMEAQIFMSAILRTLVDYPFLTSSMFQETIDDPQYDFLNGSTLPEQTERVRLTPLALNSSEAFQIWSQLPQAKSTLAILYQATVVLIEGNAMGDVPMPVSERRTYVGQNQPYIDRIAQEGKDPRTAITLQSKLSIFGRNFESADTKVRIGQTIVTPQAITNNQLTVNLLNLKELQGVNLPAGVQSLQVLHSPPSRPAPNDRKGGPDFAIESNAIAFILCPSIDGEALVVNRPPAGGWLGGVFQSSNRDPRNGEIILKVDNIVTPSQRALITMNRLLTSETKDNLISFIFSAKDRQTDTNELTFPFERLQPGEYLIRVQIDGADSELLVDTEANSPTLGQFVGPKVIIE